MKNIRKQQWENGTIDLVKFISSLLIVSIHTHPFKSYSEFFDCYFENVFSRVAVCFFFVASGYFFFSRLEFENDKIKKSKENIRKLKKYFIRLLILYTVWSLVYLIISLPEWYASGWLSLNAFIDYGISFLFDSSYYHLWFLISLLYAVPLMYLMLRFIKVKYFTVIALAIYVIGTLCDEYSWLDLPLNYAMSVFSETFPRIYTVIFCVIPILAMSLLSDKINISKSKKIFLFITFLTCYSSEAILLYCFTLNKNNFTYLFFALPTVLFLFSALNSVQLQIKTNMRYLLRKTSTIIYCLHPLIILIKVI